jgi:hypothetical protein
MYGSKKFVKQIKDRYISGDPDPALPQQNSIIKDTDPVQLLSSASNLLQCDLEKMKNSRPTASFAFAGSPRPAPAAFL